ncbi:MAG: stage III sporulation protein AG [Hungatella sp.]|nr:stage III sporulation protein AG [Hungatella sp.]
MGWKPEKWKFNWKGSKDRWLVMLAVGLIFLILAFPVGGRQTTGKISQDSGGGQTGMGSQTTRGQAGTGSQTTPWRQAEAGSQAAERGQAGADSPVTLWGQPGAGGKGGEDSRTSDTVEAGSGAVLTYEQQLEARLKELLSHVEGVGEVEVMIVLKSSEEKVWRTDRNSSYSSTRETDANGGTRDNRSQEMSESTILAGQGGGDGPLLEKELKPQIGGVVVSAAGGGSPTIQAEISAAVEALFDVPSHKIKVLKRAE